MELVAYFIVLFVVILFLVILPILGNVGNFKIGKPSSGKEKVKSKRQRLKNAINDPNLLKFKLKDEDTKGASSANKFQLDSKTGLKRRVLGNSDNQDPNAFDYDIDELINEDRLEEEAEEAKRVGKFKGKERETYEALV
ncbi:hypothetical protein NCAS_0A09090 [Naumovozyma castellii]|uniref:Uncharacterized protein n=1 Tax=Naumovozyma castellii TaxID=27288 RepID=G0V7L9_NAUCA|nr:hypothetical protein NCAS_0A09090 [Naumovozyma castellii CBS 4309]CCC67467.1 hypothetical protein NCAS_0A09090 [Naumovozyma castellii CBS 4309]